MEKTQWTVEEDRKLADLLNKGYTYSEIGTELDRGKEGVRYRWNKIRYDSVLPRNLGEDRETPINLRAVVFDLECTDFKTVGYNGFLICMSFLPLDQEEPYNISLTFDDKCSDRRLLVTVLNELTKYDILIGHNIASFDLNWLYSRAMYYGLYMPKSWVYYDTYQVSKTLAIKATRKSLLHLGSYFGIEEQKTSVLEDEWSMVRSGIKAEHVDAVENIVDHCNKDVVLNRKLFDRLWKYDNNKSFKKTKW